MIEKLTPLRWSDDSGALVVDEDELQVSGTRYAQIWAALGGLFLCAAVLLGDLLFAASATAKLATVVTGAAAAGSLVIAVAIVSLRHVRR